MGRIGVDWMFRRFLFALPFAAIAAAGVLLAIWLGAQQKLPVPSYRIVVRQAPAGPNDLFVDPPRSHPEVFVDRPKDDTALRGRLPAPPKIDPDITRPQQIPRKPMTPPRPSSPSSDGGSGAGGLITGVDPENPCKDSGGEPDPMVRMAPPVYPVPGVEADVELEFTIGADGTPKDIRVIVSSDPRFNEYAIRTVMHWRYRPQCEDDVAIERKGVRVKLEYIPVDQ